MKQTISRRILHLFGWKMEGSIPAELKKFIIIVIPHTSNWDFPLGLLVRNVLNRNVVYLAKASLFKFPYGGLFKWLGGYPVDRSKRNKFVDTVVDIFNSKEEFMVCISPEGTRKKVEKLKSGFYWMAKGAQVPLIMIKFDYGEKVIGIREPFYTTDDKEGDFEQIWEYFQSARGKIPENSWGYS